jgi:hypothetical protein
MSCSPVHEGALEDTSESFFLSETAKYLFLLFSNATALPDYYIFSTEGHLLPVLPALPKAQGNDQEENSNATDSSGVEGEPAQTFPSTCPLVAFMPLVGRHIAMQRSHHAQGRVCSEPSNSSVTC